MTKSQLAHAIREAMVENARKTVLAMSDNHIIDENRTCPECGASVSRGVALTLGRAAIDLEQWYDLMSQNAEHEEDV